MNPKDCSYVPLSLQNKNDGMIIENFKKNLELQKMASLTIIWLIWGKYTKHSTYPRLLSVKFTSSDDVEDILRAFHQLKSKADVSILPVTPYSKRNLAENISRVSR